jgi:hypothetical protein
MHRIASTLVRTAAVLVCAGCVSGTESPGRANVQAALPPGIRVVVVQVVPVKAGAIKNAGELKDAPQLFAGYLRDALAKKRPDWQVRLTDDPQRDMTVAAELAEVDGGDANLRFLIGFTAGAARSAARVSLVDRTGGSLAAAEISQVTACPVGLCTDPNEAMVRRNLQALAEEAAEFIADPAGYAKKQAAGS